VVSRFQRRMVKRWAVEGGFAHASDLAGVFDGDLDGPAGGVARHDLRGRAVQVGSDR
jgi:hypothetical protein